MGNHINVMDGERKLIGTMNIGLDAWALTNLIVKKYTGEILPIFGDVNEALEKVYAKCEPHETVMLLVFINDKSNFDESDIPHLNKAIEDWPFENENPKKFLVFIRNLLVEHDTVITEFTGVSTSAMSVRRDRDKEDNVDA